MSPATAPHDVPIPPGTHAFGDWHGADIRSPGLCEALGLSADWQSQRRTLDDWLCEFEPDTDATPSSGLGVIYTSGTTGKPKGVVRQPVSVGQLERIAVAVLDRFGIGPGTRTLVPAPLYHAAPNTAAVTPFRVMADITIMPRFVAQEFLRLVTEQRIEHCQMVPTMFIRLLELPEPERAQYDLSSLRIITHTAAPCPQHVKRAMIDWFGPIIPEYYGSSEVGAITWCDSHEWLDHPGTVGKPIFGAAVRVLAPDHTDHAVGESGSVFVKPAEFWPDFTYLGDEAKRAGMEIDGYVTLGDIGYLDGDGYLYLNDRASDMVVSGGVNIYPAEIEATIAAIPGVFDVAVFGIPDDEFGEALAAHIDVDPRSGLTAEHFRSIVRSQLASFKVPRTIVFDDNLPRDESGKLFKRQLREKYWEGTGRRI
jgi:long-chain acyl-CoA synthetase